MKHTDFSLIPTFLAIMEEMSYTGASRRLGISQSAVSQSVVKLRELFKDELFVREKRGIKPTPTAIDIYPELSKAANAIRLTAANSVKFNPQSCAHVFTISALSLLDLKLAPKLASLINTQAPNAKLRTEPLVNEDAVSLLRNQNYDLIFDVEHNQYPNLNSQVFLEDDICILCREHHPRLKDDSITKEEFIQEKHVVHSVVQSSLPFLIAKEYHANGLLSRRDIACYSSGILEMLAVVENTDYIGIFPRKIMEPYIQQHKVKVLSNNLFAEPLCAHMYWHPSRNHDPKHQWLRAKVLESAKASQ
ncbi:LysR family transcriptional regulator [Vibrio maerlii]|uniref:LysR family transcriptional regulator n=1 Tax=Vibrio maerlii TaxID=2231648 RepID=UPI000E3B93B2|nr:LysR family transcriptional regulator [Vibrio maerlii]